MKQRTSTHGRRVLIDGQRVVLTETEWRLFTELLRVARAADPVLTDRYIEHYVTSSPRAMVPYLRDKLWKTRYRVERVYRRGYRLVRLPPVRVVDRAASAAPGGSNADSEGNT